MKVVTHQSTDNIQLAVSEFKKKCKKLKSIPNTIIFFADRTYLTKDVRSTIVSAFPDVRIYGILVPREFYPIFEKDNIILNASIILIGITNELIKDIHGVIIPTNTDTLDKSINDAIASFSEHFGKPLAEMEKDRYICISALDAWGGANTEKILNRFNNEMSLEIVGILTGAGNTLPDLACCCSIDEYFYEGASLLLILEPATKFYTKQIQAVVPIGQKTIVTKVDYENSIIKELDGQPAMKRFSELIGHKNLTTYHRDRINDILRTYSVKIKGEQEDADILRDIKQFINDTDIEMYLPIEENTELDLQIQVDDVFEYTRNFINNLISEHTNIKFMFIFCCLLTLFSLFSSDDSEAESKYIDLFNVVLSAGAFSYGEIYKNNIVNKTNVVLFFE